MEVDSQTLPVDPIGAGWLAREYGVLPLGRFHVLSQIGGRRGTLTRPGLRLETYTEAMRPAANLASHLQFHLRHEVVQLEFLARLFSKTGPNEIQHWVDAEPTGQYARRAAFLYEWLTDDLLEVPLGLGGNYVYAINDEVMLAASPEKSLRSTRWRIHDNLPGTRWFCPTLVKTPELIAAASLDVKALIRDLTDEFGADVLLRATAWMTLRESKASFTLEGEADQSTRIQRFADVMSHRTGLGDLPLTDAVLADLQRAILGPVNALGRLGIRQSPVFVGETLRFQEVVHYVAPPAGDVPAMLNGLRVFLERTQGQSAVLRCAVAAFAFVYIHPLADGNGRVHRFLINDILRRDGVIAEPVILPVSAVISADAGARRAYDQVLDQVSAPLMRAVREQVEFSRVQITYPDGVVSNFGFNARNYSGQSDQSGQSDNPDDIARPLWRYPDLGAHAVYLSGVIARTIKQHMHQESKYLVRHHRARESIKEIVEMPDHQADRIIRSIEQNDAKLSNVLSREMPVLAGPGIWQAIAAAVSQAFNGTER